MALTASDIYYNGNYIGKTPDKKFEYFSYQNDLYKIHVPTQFVMPWTKFDEEKFSLELVNIREKQ
jgi:hypothetical protein